METRLIIADDHEVVRKGVVALLEVDSQLSVIAEAGSESEIWERLIEKQPDVLLLDLYFDHQPLALHLISSILKKYPKLKIIIFSIYNDERYVVQCLQQGATSYVLKNSDKHELIRAIHCAKMDLAYFPPEIATIIRTALVDLTVSHTPPAAQAQHEILGLLSDREKTILRMIGEGQSSRDIALTLNLSIYTVNNHRINMIKKTKVKNSTELVKIAHDANLF